MNLLSTTYLGNIQYYTKLIHGECMIDIHENYQKQSYRNRCDIASTDGVMSLSVSVVKGSNWEKTPLRECRIDHSKRWQHQHWQAIVTAYRASPFFEHYAHHFEPFYTTRFDYLLDYNTQLMGVVLRLLGCETQICVTDSYISPLEAERLSIKDLRNALSPKPRLAQVDMGFRAEPYWQVFSDIHPFSPNLSIIDLLFCEGPNAADIITSSAAPGRA